jgi:hypothetical protein
MQKSQQDHLNSYPKHKNGRNIQLQKVLGMRIIEYHGTRQNLSTKKKTGY